MKRAFVFSQKIAMALVAISLFTVGCAQTLCIKTVDAASGQPLAGVSAVWREDSSYELLTGQRHQAGPTNLVSSEDGTITVGGMHKKWVSRFVFSRTGYATLYGIYGPEGLTLAERIKPSPLPQDRFILEEPQIFIGPSNGCVLVKMPK
jgi:hypothetical protein